MALKLVDDRDSAITFSSPPAGQWDWNRDGFGGPSEYMSTTSLSRRKGATATFSFVGSSVSVYGTISTNVTVSAVSSYAIDGGSPTFFTAPVVAQNTYQTPFFQSSTLSPGSHTLVIQNEADDDFYWFDFIAVSPSDGTATPASSSAGGLSSSSTSTATRTSSATSSPSAPSATASPSSSSSSSAITTPSGLALASQSSVSAPSSTVTLVASQPNNQADSQKSTSNHTAAIIGGSIGAAIIIALLTGVVVWQYMRRRHKRMMDARSTIDPGPTHHHPDTETESTPRSPYTSNTGITPFPVDGSVPTTPVFSTKEATSGPHGRRGTSYDPPPMYQYAT